jgi:2-polyprenyl-6-hydroxyphenyl methylase/3-demethylubiquinone-9 3-methyltransferase
MIAKNTICLWFDKDAEEAARFYAATFPNSEVLAVHTAPGDLRSRTHWLRAARRQSVPSWP